MSLSESPLALFGALLGIVFVTVPLLALTGYSLYLGATGVLTADWTWAKAGGVLLALLVWLVPITIGIVGMRR